MKKKNNTKKTILTVSIVIVVLAIIIIIARLNAKTHSPEESLTICIDSDGGLNYLERGYAEIKKGDQTLEKIYDGCSQMKGHEGMIIEYFCNGTKINVADYYCENGCERGACK